MFTTPHQSTKDRGRQDQQKEDQLIYCHHQKGGDCWLLVTINVLMITIEVIEI